MSDRLREILKSYIQYGAAEHAKSDWWLAMEKQIQSYIDSKIIEARQDELLKACYHWEKYPNLPATYLIERKAELKKALNYRSDTHGDSK